VPLTNRPNRLEIIIGAINFKLLQQGRNYFQYMQLLCDYFQVFFAVLT
jgi:hypothetical protein